MRDLTPERPASLCFDPTLAEAPRLRLRSSANPDGTPVLVPGRLIACPRWIQPTYDALAEGAEHGRDLAILRGNRITAVVRSQQGSDPTRRRLQHRRHDDHLATLALARALILAKTAGQVAVLRRHARQRPDPHLAERADACAKDRHGLAGFTTLEALRGREGIIARSYFGGWPRLLGLPSFQRIPRRALNPINHLLDLAYSRLCQAVTLHLLDQGLDLALGTLHSPDDRRPTLALDLMEPLRPPIADRFVIACHQDALNGGWLQEEQGRWHLTSTGRQRFRDRWERWMHGGSRRDGQLHLVADCLHIYGRWLDNSDDLSFPTYAG